MHLVLLYINEYFIRHGDMNKSVHSSSELFKHFRFLLGVGEVCEYESFLSVMAESE